MEDLTTGSGSKRHASQRVADVLRQQIDAGRFASGDQLPSYRQLAEEHGIAVNTAQVAVKLLMHEGRVVVRRSSGAFVAPTGPGGEVSDRGGEVDDVEDVRAELSEVRRHLRDMGGAALELERRVAGMVDRLGRERL